MKYQVLFSLKNNEKVFMNVAFCSRGLHQFSCSTSDAIVSAQNLAYHFILIVVNVPLARIIDRNSFYSLKMVIITNFGQRQRSA